MKSKLLLVWVYLLTILIVIAWPGSHPVEAAQPAQFDPIVSLAGVLAPGALGLPGEQVTWVVTISNAGAAAGTDLVITDVFSDVLRIDRVQTLQGQAAVSEQTVVYSLPVLNPGETAQVSVVTTVLRSPANAVLVNQAVLEASGPQGPVSKNAAAQIFVATGLPATGYPPGEDLPGDGEPSAGVFALVAFSLVGLTALFVWYRGRRQWLGH